MEQHVFALEIIIEGTTDKVIQFIMPLKSIYNKNLDFIELKCIFEHCREIQTSKCLLIDILFVTKKILMTCSELPSVDKC
jgi:hypothetical protein